MKSKKALMSVINFLLITITVAFNTTNYLEKNAFVTILIIIFISNILILLMTNKKSFKNDFLDIISFLTNTIAFILIVFNIFFFTSKVEGTSMDPTIHEGDRLYINKFMFNIKHNDILVYKTEDEYIVKRVAALEGDKIEVRVIEELEIKHYYLYINDELYLNNYDESYSLSIFDKLYHIASKPYILKADEIVLLGDNALKSKDSRQDGIYIKKYVVGKRIGKIKWLKIQDTNK